MRAMTTAHPYELLTPQRVLDTLQTAGWLGDGRLLQLNSYENRVFQVMLDDGAAVVAKFYRPGRWSDAQILEEHRFALQLAQQEIPVVAPLPLPRSNPMTIAGLQCVGEPPTLACWLEGGANFRLSVYARRAGHGPELDDPSVLSWLGRFAGRVHAVGSSEPFQTRRRLDASTYGHRPLQRLLDSELVMPAQQSSFE